MCFGSDADDLAGAIDIKCRAQQQVFRRISAQRKFRGQQQVRTLFAGAVDVFDNLVGIAGQIADSRIKLRDGEFHCYSKGVDWNTRCRRLYRAARAA